MFACDSTPDAAHWGPWVCSIGSADAATASASTGAIVRGSDNADQQHLLRVHPDPPRRRGLRRAAHDGHRRDAAARRPRRRVDPAPGAVGEVGARVRQPQRRPVVRRRAGRHPGPDARLQPGRRRNGSSSSSTATSTDRPPSPSPTRTRRPSGSPAAGQRRDVLHQRGDAVAGRPGRHVAPGAAGVPGRPGDVEVGPRPVVDELLEERRREQGGAPPHPVVLEHVGDLALGADGLAGLVGDRQPPEQLAARVGGRGDGRGRLVVAEERRPPSRPARRCTAR